MTDAISALGLEEGTHQLGQLAIEVKGGRALVAGTETLCGSIANMNQCIQFFIKAVCKSFQHRTCKEGSWESCTQSRESELSQSHETVKCGRGCCGAWNQE